MFKILALPRSDPGSGFTALFETLVIDWRREQVHPKQLGIDETAFKKRHDDVTIISDQETDTVLL